MSTKTRYLTARARRKIGFTKPEALQVGICHWGALITHGLPWSNQALDQAAPVSGLSQTPDKTLCEIAHPGQLTTSRPRLNHEYTVEENHWMVGIMSNYIYFLQVKHQGNHSSVVEDECSSSLFKPFSCFPRRHNWITSLVEALRCATERSE